MEAHQGTNLATILALAVIASIALTGCIGSDSALETAGSDDPATASQPEPAPLDVHLTHDFTGEGETVTFEVPEGAAVSSEHISFGPAEDTPAIMLCATAGSTAEIVVKDPAGGIVHHATMGGGGANLAVAIGGSCGADAFHSQQDPGVPIAPGTWTVEFSGTGMATGHVIYEG